MLPPPPPPRTVADWQALVVGRLPSADQVLARNYALTAQYARWYKANPGIFKWAGMASFSSHRVGLALTPYEMIMDVEQLLDNPNVPGPGDAEARQIVDIKARGDSLDPEIPLVRKAAILPGLNMLRLINNAVFKDIGWAHEAYAQGGLAAVETATGADPKFRQLKVAFQQIDAGRLQMQGNTPAAYQSIWQGNLSLLEREQRDIIQPRLKDATVLFKTFLTAATVLEYWVNPFHIHPRKMTVFPFAMVVFNLPFLFDNQCLPAFSNFDQRWAWIKKRVIPIFQRLDGSDPEIMTSIEEIIAAGGQIIPPGQPVQPVPVA